MNEQDFEQLRQAGNAPALEVEQARLIKRLEAERDALQGEIAELLDYAERGGGAYEQDGFAGYSEKGKQVFELLKLLREESMASAFLNDELNRLEAALKPFALAANDPDVMDEFPGVNLVTEQRMLCIYINHDEQHAHDDESHFLKVRHLRAAAAALKDKRE